MRDIPQVADKGGFPGGDFLGFVMAFDLQVFLA
jgi:hypothetical protein